MNKKIIKILVAVAVLLILAVALLLFASGLQMRVMSNLLMKQVSEYNFKQILGEDPVRDILTDTLGEDKPESVEYLYDLLKGSASSMKWEVESINKSEKQTSVAISYIDITDFAERYAYNFGTMIAEKVISGDIVLTDEASVLSSISDAENVKLISAAVESTELTDMATCSAIITFEKKYGALIPNGVSEELYDAASGGLFSQAERLQSMIKAGVINTLIDRTFEMIKAFDLEAIEEFSGYDLSSIIAIGNQSELGGELIAFLADCASKIQYSIESENGDLPIVINCTYCDASGIVSSYVANLVKYAASALFGNQTQMTGGELLAKTIEEAGTLPLTESVISISFNEVTGKPEISGDIADILSANLLGSLSDLSSFFQ